MARFFIADKIICFAALVAEVSAAEALEVQEWVPLER